ncbi:hypothetical protein POK33_27370, partial [Burkholderia cenocepacia]|uniref:hypothetical protein n=1 Tax=Burkholderia cenocepacia TaxID=95486 RepID=UPI0023B9630E
RVGRDAQARVMRDGHADRTGNAGPPSAGGRHANRPRTRAGRAFGSAAIPLRFGFGHPHGREAGAPATSRRMSVPRRAAGVQPAA